MYHAMVARVSEFGVYNDVAIAIAWLLARGAGRIAYMDIDAPRRRGAGGVLAHDLAGGRWRLTGGRGMSWSGWCRGPGRTCSPRPPASRSTQRRRPPSRGVSMSGGDPAVYKPFDSGYEQGHPVDRAIIASRNARASLCTG
jgi:hypothetical protein